MMTSTTQQAEPRTRPRRRRIFVALVAILLVVVAILSWVSFLRHPVMGHLRLGTAQGESDLEIFVGNRLVGRTRAEVPWSDIFGWAGQQNLGIILPEDAGPVDRDADDGDLGEITAERLGGQGAVILHATNGSPMWNSNRGRQEFSKKEILLRRRDGSLDHLFCLDGRLNDLNENPHRVLVLVRVRTPDGEPHGYFTTEPRGTSGGRFDNVLNRACPEWNFEHAEPPVEFAQEIREQGLWRPSN